MAFINYSNILIEGPRLISRAFFGLDTVTQV